MEDIADTLKITFAVFVFMYAVLITYIVSGMAKRTSDSVLYSADRTSFYNYRGSSDINRIVTHKEIITTLYRIADGETITVTINNGGTTIAQVSGSHSRDDIRNLVNSIFASINTRNYTEEFVEVNYSGKYRRDADGNVIVIEPGGTRLYVTYTAT